VRDFIDCVAIPMAAILGVGVLCFGALFLVSDQYVQYQCGNYTRATGKETRYMRFDSCYINTESGWQRWDEYKMRAAASEGLSALDD
jgi:hypothetical protein